tara:strand:- start:1788 stop:2534 length:747 start_codon:yes stop_codon:yes gene_type:complete
MGTSSANDLATIIGNRSLLSWHELFISHMQSIDHHFDPGHKIDHVIRVTNNAIALAESENADLAIIVPAVILHDTIPVGKFSKSRAKASQLSAEHSIQLLTDWKYPAKYLPAIKHAILTHSFSAAMTPTTLEAKVVQDADRLDALGAIGIARTMAVGFKHGNPLYLPSEPFPVTREVNDESNVIDHFYVKLFSLPETMHTNSAKREAIIRITLMESYLKALARELGVAYLSYEEFISARSDSCTHTSR